MGRKEIKGNTLRSRPAPSVAAKPSWVVGAMNTGLLLEPTDSWGPPTRKCAKGEIGPGKRSCGPTRYVFKCVLEPWCVPDVSLYSAARASGPRTFEATETSQPLRLRCWVFAAVGQPGMGKSAAVCRKVTGACVKEYPP